MHALSRAHVTWVQGDTAIGLLQSNQIFGLASHTLQLNSREAQNNCINIVHKSSIMGRITWLSS